ncbi:MAG TPA: geranylgeranyl reductase family protein, partial [Gemmatimonadales bacterium]|nr:geranylgeranyl reductase family protein [Gemmatimonadales bacterium]
VVGAGPGGSNAAAVALKYGLSVAQVDKSRFPRIKPCGGGLTIKSCRALQFDLQPMLRGEFREFEFNVLHRRSNQFAHLRSAVLRMVDRPQFDNWLVSENLKASRFRFFDAERVLDISFDGLFHVRTPNRLLQGRHLVGADGAYSLVNRHFSITRPLGFAVAVEVTLRRDRARLPAETPPCFDFGAVESGYGWVFPKDDHWNVGLYTLNKSRHLREQLAAYIAVKGFRVEGDPLATFAGHQFPYGGYRITLPEAPVYIVGDAGGFGDPIVGEGIYHALESGRIAGETTHDCLADTARHQEYYQRLEASVLADTRVTHRIGRAVYRDVGKAMKILENPMVWRPVVQGNADGATFTGIIRKSGWFLLKSLALRSVRSRRKCAKYAVQGAGRYRG